MLTCPHSYLTGSSPWVWRQKARVAPWPRGGTVHTVAMISFRGKPFALRFCRGSILVSSLGFKTTSQTIRSRIQRINIYWAFMMRWLQHWCRVSLLSQSTVLGAAFSSEAFIDMFHLTSDIHVAHLGSYLGNLSWEWREIIYIQQYCKSTYYAPGAVLGPSSEQNRQRPCLCGAAILVWRIDKKQYAIFQGFYDLYF